MNYIRRGRRSLIVSALDVAVSFVNRAYREVLPRRLFPDGLNKSVVGFHIVQYIAQNGLRLYSTGQSVEKITPRQEQAQAIAE